MHRLMCRTDTSRDCLRGQRGHCRVCPYRKGGEFYKTAAEEREDLVRSWYLQVVSGASSIDYVPISFRGRALSGAVRERVERHYRRAARRLTTAQKQTIEGMRAAAPNDVAQAAGCSTDDVYLWLLPSRTRPASFHDRPLELAGQKEAGE